MFFKIINLIIYYLCIIYCLFYYFLYFIEFIIVYYILLYLAMAAVATDDRKSHIKYCTLTMPLQNSAQAPPASPKHCKRLKRPPKMPHPS